MKYPCDKFCQWLTTGWWFSQSTPVSSINKTDRHHQAEIFLKVALNTINLTLCWYTFKITNYMYKENDILIFSKDHFIWQMWRSNFNLIDKKGVQIEDSLCFRKINFYTSNPR